MSTTKVTNAAELQQAITGKAPLIEVVGTVQGAPSFTLPQGTEIYGGTLQFGGRGLNVSTDNIVRDIRIETSVTEIALGTDRSVDSLGTLTLQNVTTVGQIALYFDGKLRSGTVKADGIEVEQADLRGRERRPHGYGVDVLQGGFTLWNQQTDPSSVIKATLKKYCSGQRANTGARQRCFCLRRGFQRRWKREG